ncbi:hypothetical protein V2J09_020109 [Rumex salicifolius]
MKRIRKWQRICFLTLLFLSVCPPIVLVSYRLKTLALEGAKEFVEDLSSIKIRADSLKLSAVEQEDEQGLKEPKQEVYRDQYISIVSYSSNESLKDKHTDRDIIRITSLERKESDNRIEDHVNIHRKEEEVPSNPTKELQTDIGIDLRNDQNVISTTARRTQDNHGSNMQIPRPVTEKVKKLKDQLIRATAYLSFATEMNNVHLVKELKQRIKEVDRALGDATKDSELKKSAFSKMRIMEATLSKANHVYPDCAAMMKRLQEMAESTYKQIQEQKNQTKSLIQIAGRTTPKGLHCLSMKLTTEYFSVPFEGREPVNKLNFHNPDLFHYVIFSDNVLACAVVVNSTVTSAKEQEKIVFHIVTDSVNFPGISMWFLLNPPGQASIHVQSIDSFKILSTKYGSPYADMENYIDPRYASPLNHFRFHLPELFPDLDKVVFLDHDVVVLKDLSALWKVDMKGKVNAAVQTCHQDEPSFRRMNMLINFSDPWIAKEFDANSCTWAFGMNLFDLNEWRNQDLTSKYHKYLLMGFKRPLWTPRSLSLGWITFYNHTFPLDQNWHVLGLGHSTAVKQENIEQAAVIHYDGIMKPWLDIRIRRYKDYWAKYINFDHPYLHQCNINE